MTQRYFALGPLPGAPHARYAVLGLGNLVIGIQISRPDGMEVDRPAAVRWPRGAAQGSSDNGRLPGCDWPETCGGLVVYLCDGCGGDLCVCTCGGEMPCDGCPDCNDALDDYPE